MSQRIHKIMCGKTERWTFSKIKPILDMPYLIEVQKNSYDAFIKDGIREVFEDFSPITDFSGKFELEFLDHSIEGPCKYTVNGREAKPGKEIKPGDVVSVAFGDKRVTFRILSVPEGNVPKNAGSLLYEIIED